MTDIITDYQKWKQQGENLRTQAKQAMEARYRDLLTEAVQIAEEYRADFGAALKLPPQVTAFRYKASTKSKAKKSAPAKAAAKSAPAAPAAPNPKILGLQKKLATAKKKLEEAKTAGTPTRPHEDRVYEIEDALRLATQAG
jgi:hypothetical protein